MLKPAKRIVTNVNERKSSIESVQTVMPFTPYPQYPSFQIQELFYTDNPLSLATRHIDTAYDINLPTGSTRVLKLRMPTQQEIITDLQNAGQPLPEDWTRFNMHTTATVDLVYIVSGAITLITGDGQQQEVKAGDLVAQIGAEHTWLNTHDEPCIFLAFIQGIESNIAQTVMF